MKFSQSLGIYVQPNKELHEGLFYKNKPDGPGSKYSYDAATTSYIEREHGIWDKGRNVQELYEKFCPSAADLPSNLV